MMSRHISKTAIFLGITTLFAPASASALTELSAEELQPEKQSAKILPKTPLSDDVAELADVDIELAADDDSQWALNRALRRDFAMTRELGHAIKRRMVLPMMTDVSLAERLLVKHIVAGLRVDAAHEALLAKADAFDIPLSDHPLVDTYIEYFTGRGRAFFSKWLARADRYIPLMQPILEERGLPGDLVYVAMIESGFSSRAVSVAAASGYWQFIRSTGQMYGMRMDSWVDERRDFIRATKAAADYMTALHREFKDWHLAWAGYNAGSGRVRRALERYGAKDYWDLVENKKSLAKETRHYVSKIIAAAIVAKNRKRYGFAGVEPLPPLQYDELRVDDAVSLRVVAEQTGASVEILRELNPSLLQDVTPPGRSYMLRVPEGEGDQTLAWLESVPKEQKLTYKQHAVRSGDTLWRIAERYRTTIAAIRDFNGIRNPRSLKIGQSLIIPTLRQLSATPSARSKVAGVASKANTANSASKKHHVVAAGETLWAISQLYGVTVQDLRSRNNLSDNIIVAGNRIRLH